MPNPRPDVRSALPSDLPAIRALLEANDLHLDRSDGRGFLVAVQGDEIVGAIALETYDDYGLLRSAVVSDAVRGTGLGGALVKSVVADARSRNLRAVYLFTETAERYFPRFGFAKTTREAIPEPVRRSSQFTISCPASATVMVLELNA